MTRMRGARRTSRRIFEAIAAGPRREILRLLLARSAPVGERELVAHLVAGQHRTTGETTAERPAVETALAHVHLPTLAATGLIVRDRDDDTVDTASHPAFDDPRFRLLLEAEVDGLDEALSNLAVDRRRVLLTVLREAAISMTRRDLAREILRSDETDLEPERNAVDDVIASLYHVHLPALDDAGLVEYDRETDRAAYAAHPALEEVLTIIYEPGERLVDSYDGFLGGLEAAYERWRRGMGTGSEAEWPHFWGHSAHD